MRPIAFLVLFTLLALPAPAGEEEGAVTAARAAAILARIPPLARELWKAELPGGLAAPSVSD